MLWEKVISLRPWSFPRLLFTEQSSQWSLLRGWKNREGLSGPISWGCGLLWRHTDGVTPLPPDFIVIAFWVSLASFVTLLFLILLYMSWSGSSQGR